MAVFSLTTQVQVTSQPLMPAQDQPKCDCGQVPWERVPCSECGENVKQLFSAQKRHSLTREEDLTAGAS